MEDGNLTTADTVTLSLVRYETMQKELKTLREQVQEKTVIKYVWNPFPIIAFIILFWVIFVICYDIIL